MAKTLYIHKNGKINAKSYGAANKDLSVSILDATSFVLVRLAKPALFYQLEVVFSTHR
ncbi:hypothetical protein [Desulforamulus ruminis]|uniref:hypothetical protein n=1 Tax=Desulforamulus ruminis TaxID=1564 RepID=UPI000310690F|nr:hypothetical protein [Desulforamulus ruminis]